MVKVLENQTLYQCEYCDKRLLTKAGAKLHETRYCKESPIVLDEGRKIIESCEHEWLTSWSPIPGEEHLSEPDYDYCSNCGVRTYELGDNTTNSKKALFRAISHHEDNEVYKNHERQREAVENDQEMPF